MTMSTQSNKTQTKDKNVDQSISNKELKTQSKTFDLKAYLSRNKEIVETALDTFLPVEAPTKGYEAMRYSLLAGGKRLRPILCIATCELLGGTTAMALPTACAIEMVHTMSLIHDDLPAMDNDDFRRGKPTNHKVYGKAIAILAGDGLIGHAFECLVENSREIAPSRLLKVVAILGRAIGMEGLVGGQVVDLASEGKSDISVETLHFIHRRKTSALLEASVLSGALLMGATENMQLRLRHYAQNIGLAFQIIDDVLDITATSESLGKSVGKDLLVKKATYPSMWGLERSTQIAQHLVKEAKGEIAELGEKALPLMAIADFIVKRTH